MAKLTTLTAIVLLASFVASADQAGPPGEGAVQAVDDRFRKAMTQGDVGELEQIVADDAKIIHGNRGGIQDKAGLIKEFRSYGIERYERTPVYSAVNGNSAVLVSITQKFFQGGGGGRSIRPRLRSLSAARDAGRFSCCKTPITERPK